MTAPTPENPGFDRSEFVPYSEGDLKVENLPLLDGGVEAVADVLIALPKFPDPNLIMDRYSVKELGQILDVLTKKDEDMKSKMEKTGLSTAIGQSSTAAEGSDVEKQVAGMTKGALQKLRKDIAESQAAAAAAAEAAKKVDTDGDTEPTGDGGPDIPEGAEGDGHAHGAEGEDAEGADSTDALQAGVDAGVDVKESAEGVADEVNDIWDGKGSGADKMRKTADLLKVYGEDGKKAWKEGKKAFRKEMKKDGSFMGMIVAVMEMVSVITGKMDALREKRKGKKKEKLVEGREMFTGKRGKISASISFGGKTPRVTSAPGPRMLGDKYDSDHAGYDLADVAESNIDGAPIVAEQELTVKKIAKQGVGRTGAGYYVHLETPDGKLEKLMHLKEPITKEVGYVFQPGEVIAHVGASGTKHAHLHYETDAPLMDVLAEQARVYRDTEDDELHRHGHSSAA